MNKQYPTLYKRDSKGKILEWKVQVQNNHNQVDIMMSYGEIDGEHTIRWQRDIKGKNIGKSNETNAWEQACNDVDGKILRKKRSGYKDLVDITGVGALLYDENLLEVLQEHLPKNNTNLEGNLSPMKAQQYYRSKKNWIDPTGKLWKDRKYYYLKNPHVSKEKGAIITKFPAAIQAKINGVRCFCQLIDGEVKLFSKMGIEYNIPHIIDFFTLNSELFNNGEVIFDGELYIHNEKLEVISSAVKKMNLNTQRVEFYVFDLAIPNKTFIERRHLLNDIMESLLDGHISPCVVKLKTLIVKSDQRTQVLTDQFIAAGFEGSILRDLNTEYQFGKRPMSMTKLKRVIDEEFTIVDIVPQPKQPDKGMFLCRTDQGKEFEVNPTMSEQDKQILLVNKSSFIGKQLTCTFYEYTDDGLPYHIIDTIIRDYE